MTNLARWDATNSVRLCDGCDLEQGVLAGADAGDRACAACGAEKAPNVYVGLAEHELIVGRLAAFIEANCEGVQVYRETGLVVS